VNDHKVDITSYQVKQGDKISIKAADKAQSLIKTNLEIDANAPVQAWLQFNSANLEGSVVSLPTRDDVQIPVEEQLIVEFCSR